MPSPQRAFAFAPAPALALVLAVGLAACGDNLAAPPEGSDAPDAGPSEDDPPSSTLVTIADGQLQGEIDGESRRFLGIPFATPPVGALRWKAPVPSPPWEGVRDATAFGPGCAQPSSLQSSASEVEDCLYLNVWTPEPPPESPLPVMVWFHGGGNTTGSTADQVPLGVGGLFYDGRALAERYGVVVVSTNYRLGALGFFHHPGLAAEGSPQGNQGILDQRRALEWVRDNIDAFGGDPDSVTIFGESAGAFDVCFHVASPGSAGLFHRAISQSGGCTTRMDAPADLVAGVSAFVEAMGCTGARDPLACLREQPVSALLTEPPVDGAPAEPLPGGDGYQGGTPLWDFSPIVDGTVIPDQPRALFDAGEVAQVPWILGSNTDEGTLFHIGGIPVDTEEEYLDALGRRFGETLADEIAGFYPVADFESPEAALARVTGDAALVCSTHDTARRAAAAGLPVWMYNFDFPIPIPGLEFLGATHGAEIAFVFDTVEGEPQTTIGHPMRSYWTSLARTGSPVSYGAFAWPAFSPDDDRRINFAVPLEVRTDFRSDQCAFWRTVYSAAFE
jgi:para-nitrobenzyl esterase